MGFPFLPVLDGKPTKNAAGKPTKIVRKNPQKTLTEDPQKAVVPEFRTGRLMDCLAPAIDTRQENPQKAFGARPGKPTKSVPITVVKNQEKRSRKTQIKR